MKFTKNDVRWFGRNLDYKDVRYFDYSASGFEFSFKGKKAVCTILSDAKDCKENEKGVLGIFITNSKGDDVVEKQVLTEEVNNILLFESEKEETVHIKVMRFSEAIYGYSGFVDGEIDGTLIPLKDEKKKLKLEFIGDSITCGYGIEGVYGKDVFTTTQERPDLAYAYLTAQKLDADFHLISRSGIGLISCYTDPLTVKLPNTTEPLMSQLWPYTDRFLSTRLGIESEIWDEKKFSPDIVILHLGTNDNSWVRGLEDRRLSFVNLYKQMLEAIHRRSPNAEIFGCLGAMGQDLCDSEVQAFEEFKKDFPSVKTRYLKFDLQDENKDGVGTDWHPSAKTHAMMAEKLARKLSEK